MPLFPEVSSSVAAMGGSVYSALAHRLANHRGPTFPLHVGDTWMEPAVGCRLEDIDVREHPGMHRYVNPHGHPALLDILSERIRSRTGVATGRENLLVTAGATAGLSAVVGTLVSPGEEVLIMAPYWPLIAGMVALHHGVPTPVPYIGAADSAEDGVRLFEAACTERTVAIYINTPNNPSGRVVPPEWIEALVGWAAGRGLWVISDEIYEDYVYEGVHAYARSFAPERTISAYSFSKAFGMAGNRCGYVVGPADAMGQLRKVGTHAWYSAPTGSQLAAIRVLSGPGDEWIAQAAPLYAQMGRDAARRLGCAPPQGSTFLFLDVAESLDDRGLAGFLEDCVERGLLVAPGPSFGPYPTHVRVCFTSAPPPVVSAGVEHLAALLGR